ncbi:MAG: hypothetical protein JNN15_09930 [Blastocatellia bacterium]|nr:hypothetical protein [Blastocatellia bacterium]
MQFLVIARIVSQTPPTFELVQEEASVAFGYQQDGSVRSIHFIKDESGQIVLGAVLLFEATKLSIVQDLVAALPFIRERIAEAEIITLHPFTGYDAIIC